MGGRDPAFFIHMSPRHFSEGLSVNCGQAGQALGCVFISLIAALLLFFSCVEKTPPALTVFLDGVVVPTSILPSLAPESAVIQKGGMILSC